MSNFRVKLPDLEDCHLLWCPLVYPVAIYAAFQYGCLPPNMEYVELCHIWFGTVILL